MIAGHPISGAPISGAAEAAGPAVPTATATGGHRRTATSNRLDGSAVYWESTAAITRIQIQTDNHATDLFVAGSSMKLIGYRALTVLM